MLYSTILYYTILYYTILYYTILYYITLIRAASTAPPAARARPVSFKGGIRAIPHTSLDFILEKHWFLRGSWGVMFC